MIAITGLAATALSCADKKDDFKYLVDEFADLKIMRYQVPGWDELSLQQKEYVYHLNRNKAGNIAGIEEKCDDSENK